MVRQRRPTSILRRCMVIVAAVCCTSAASAQAQPAAQPSIAVGTRLVPVVVTTGSNAASGLTKPDLTVTVNGAAQTLTVFREVKPAASGWKPASTTAGQFTQAEATREPQLAGAIVLDTIHTEAADEAGLRTAVVKYLTDAAGRGEMVALFILSDKGLELVHDLRIDTADFQAVMKQVNEGGKKGSPKSLPITLVGDPHDKIISDEVARIAAFAHGYQANSTPINTQPRGNIELPLQAWAVLAQYLGGITGRKSIEWISARVPFEINPSSGALVPPTTLAAASTINGQAVSGGRTSTITGSQAKKYETMWERAIQALHQNQVVLDVLEVRPAGTAASITQATMESMAAMTGGSLFWGVNDMNAALSQTARQSTDFYLVGYTPPAGGSWQKETVKVSKPELRILAPSGFFATQTTTDPASTRQSDFDNAFQVPVDQTAVPFVVQVGATDAAGAKKRVNLTLLLPGGSFAVDERAQNKVMLDIAAAAFDKKGGVAGQFSTAVNTNLPAEAVEQIRANGTALKAAVDVPPGDYDLRCVVRDDLTGKVGSLAIPLIVK